MDHEGAGKAGELRDLVVQAGLDVLKRDGFALRAESISYKRVFEHLKSNYGIRVTRGSVHERIWANQDEFQFEVLLKVIEETPAFGMMPPTDTGHADVSSAALAIEIESARRLRNAGLHGPELLKQWCQESGARLAGQLTTSASLSQHQALKGMARASIDGEQRARLFEALNRRDIAGFESSRAGTSLLLAELELRPRAALGLDEAESLVVLGSLIRALSAAAVLDHHIGLDGLLENLAMPSEGRSRWTGFSVGRWAFYRLLFEPDDPTAAAVRRERIEPWSGIKPVEGPDPLVKPSLLRHRLGLRRSRAELKELVLAAGVEVLARDGLALAPVSLTYAAAFELIEEQHGFTVNRSSVHRRFWSSQQDYRYEVLSRSVVLDPHDLFSRIGVAVGDIATTSRAEPDLDWTERLRRLALRAQEVAGEDPDYARRQTVRAAVLAGTDSEAVDNLRVAASSAGYDKLSMFVKLSAERLAVEGFTDNRDLGLRPEEVHGTFAMLVSSLIAGLDFNIFAGLTLAGSLVEVRSRAEPDRRDQWNLLGIGARALLELFFDPPN